MNRNYIATDETWMHLTSSLEMYEHYIRGIAENSVLPAEQEHFTDQADRVAALWELIESDDVTITLTVHSDATPPEALAVAQDALRHPEDPQQQWEAVQAAEQAQNALPPHSSSTGLC